MRFPTVEQIEAARQVVESKLADIPPHVKTISNLPIETILSDIEMMPEWQGLIVNMSPEKKVKISYRKLEAQFNF